MAKDPIIQGVNLEKGVAPPPKRRPCEILEKMRNNPGGDWSIKDVETLCAQTGLRLKAPTRGSHYKVSVAGEHFILTIPAEKPVKKPYIRKLVAMADRMQSRTGAGQ